MTDPLRTGATVGILGGGQLGRMLSVAAARLGYRCHIFEPSPAPAADVAHTWTQAGWEDTDALTAFANACDVITLEWENVPVPVMEHLSPLLPVRPGPRALEIAQDRLTEKDFLAGLGLGTAPYRAVDTLEGLTTALTEIGTPAILKTRRMGYDGKGQVRLNEQSDAQAAWDAMQGAPAILEGFVPFSSEVSVIVARNAHGEVACYDPGQNLHESGILRTTTVPALLPARLRQDAVLLAGRIVSALDYIGVMGVELFVLPERLVVNEIAPRVHNSGHWTQAGCVVDQFEQHIRAITGWPLGDGRRYADVVMENLIGDDIDRLPGLSQAPGTQIHLYGKADVRPGRKMGHVNRIQS